MKGEAAPAAWRVQCGGNGMVRIYHKRLLQRVFAAIVLAAIILLLVYLIGVVLLNAGPFPMIKIAVAVALGGIALVLLRLLATELTYTVTLTDDTIAVSRWGWERVLARSEIAGRRELRGGNGRRWVTFIPIDPQAAPLRLASSLATDAAFEAWIAGLRDLNAEDLKASEAGIADDPRYGATPQQRLARLARARTVMKGMNIAAIGVAAWCLIAPWPYLAAIGAAAIFPMLAAVVVAASGGLVRFVRLPTEAHAGAAAAPVFCAIALALRVYWDIYLVDWGPALTHGVVVGFVLLTLAAILDRSLVRPILRLGVAAFAAVAYGIAVLVLADVHFDRSPGRDFQSRVLDSRINRGKGTSYFVTLAPWGPWRSAGEILVPHALFDRLTPGAPACIRMYDGTFGVRWFSVAACAPGASTAAAPGTTWGQTSPATDPFTPFWLPCPPGRGPTTLGAPLLPDCSVR
jgi:tetrahydromethanopterin S-methyltransferase subunit E